MMQHRSETGLALPLQPPARPPEKSHDTTSKWSERRERFRSELFVIWFLLRQPKTPWYVRMIAGLVAAYVVSPIQLIPSFIPVIGFMDDVAVAAAGMAMIRYLAPSHLIEEARKRARTASAHGENVVPAARRTTTIIVASCWLLVSICFFVILYRF